MFESLGNPKQREFLTHYSRCAQITVAAKRAKVSRESHYKWMASDFDYARSFVLAKQIAGDALEDEAAKRAFAKSDRALIFLLEHLKPNVYGKQVNGDRTHSAEIPQRPEVDLTALSDDELDTLERILAKAGVEHNAGSDSNRAEAPVTEPCLSAVAGNGKVLMQPALKTD